MKKITFICLIAIIGCKNKPVMSNMLGEDDIDISNLINKGYKPFYCDNRIVKLISPNVHTFNDKEKIVLRTAVIKWIEENSHSQRTSEYEIDSSFDVAKNTHYQYSYLITDYPVDVYKTRVVINKQNVDLFIRKDGDSFLAPYAKTNWIISKCD